MLQDRIRDARLRAGLTLDEVAQKVGVSKQTIQRYESGIISNIPSDNIEKIAAALGTTPAELMGWKTNNTNNEVPLTVFLKAGTPEYALMRVYLSHSEPIQKEMARRAEMIDSVFAQNVSRLLKESGDINGFMRKTGLDFDTVGKFMQGETVLTFPDESERIAKFFNVDIVDMFFGEPKLPIKNEDNHAGEKEDYVSPEAAYAMEMELINKLFSRSSKTIQQNSISYKFLEALSSYIKNESKPSYEKTKIAIRHIKSKNFDQWLDQFLKSIQKKNPKIYVESEVLFFLAGELYKSPAMFHIEFTVNAFAVHNYMILRYHKLL